MDRSSAAIVLNIKWLKRQISTQNVCCQARPLQLYVPDETTGPRYHTWRLVTSPPFENFVLLLIILNTFSLMLKYHDAPLFYVDILSYCNLLFTTLFTIEAVLKIFGYGPKVGYPTPMSIL